MIVQQVDNQITRWSKIGALIFLGWFASSAYHGTLTADQAVKELPKVEAKLHKDDCTVKKVAKVAKQAILANKIDSVPTPELTDIKPCTK